MFNIVGIIQFLKILKELSSLKLFGPQLSLGDSLLACSYQSYEKQQDFKMSDQKNHKTCLMKILIKLTLVFKFLGKKSV